jgi:hypothetical protein
MLNEIANNGAYLVNVRFNPPGMKDVKLRARTGIAPTHTENNLH